MRIILVWMLFPRVWAVLGPLQVTAHWGSSLSVSCSYQPGYRDHPKVWCKPRFFKIFCTYMAQTNGSEAVVTQGRVSIRDNHTALTFVVTMSNVTPEDAGSYYCGVVKFLWHNQWHKTEVLVSEATAEASDARPLAKTPLSPTGCEEPPALSQLDVTLLLLLLSVKVPVILTLLCGAVWLKNRHRGCITWENLQQSETSSSTGARGSLAPQQPDPPAAPQHPAVPLPHALPGLSHRSCSALVSSLPAKPQPLLVPPKLHKGRVGVQRSHVCYIIITSEQKPWAQWGRISIWDNRTQRVFTVTVENLAAGDAGTYHCGVKTHALQHDVTDTVQVIVSSAPTSKSPASSSTLAVPPGSSSGPTRTPHQQETAKQTARPTSPGELSEKQLDVVMEILIPCIAVVLFLLSLAAVVLAVLTWKRKKALAEAPMEMDSTRGTASAEVLQYADINHAAGTEQSHLYSNLRAVPVSPQAATEYSEVKKPGQNLEGNAETLYTKVCKVPLEEEEHLYANMAASQQRAAQ
ncbi:uncharacterized protein LOC110407508 [Numida meleagris]|uniref:uncharacterized protein LOC110407508 n=1 Tax=Numida meleagris TaxID=8996 RepID=UPI000B3DF429|nr:uncharacterized protein LOC110407508 [Numida meleagris]